MTASSGTARLIFAGGGTGGHLYPAVAIADRISELLGGKRKVEILFVGTKRGLEYRLRESLGYPLQLINVRGLARSFTLKNLVVPFMLLGALLKSSSVLGSFRPDIVVGTGGYVSFPVLRMAVSRKITTVLQEQNSFPGISTRRLARYADRIYLGFAGAHDYLSTPGKVIVTGNPVRASIASGDRREAASVFKLDPNKKTILVMGGSQGAASINDAVLRSLNAGKLSDSYQLLWQTGKRAYKDVIAKAGDKAVDHALFPFENRMELVYAAADLAVARAGALTLAERQACRLPSILIPYPHAAGDHQTKNAQHLVANGHAEMIQENELSRIDLLEKAMSTLETNRADEMRKEIADSTAGRKPAVDIIAEDIICLIEQKDERR